MNHIKRITTGVVQQQNVTAHSSKGASFNFWALGKLNIGLGVFGLGLLLGFVIQTNMLASQTWQMRQAQDDLSVNLEQRNTLVAQQSQFDDRSVLQDLATKQGLVPAGAVVYLVPDSSVAVVR